MKWTREIPTEAGMYWLRSKKFQLHFPIKSVCKIGEELKVIFDPWDITKDKSFSELPPDCQWAGPIPEPTEEVEVDQDFISRVIRSNVKPLFPQESQ